MEIEQLFKLKTETVIEVYGKRMWHFRGSYKVYNGDRYLYQGDSLEEAIKELIS